MSDTTATRPARQNLLTPVILILLVVAGAVRVWKIDQKNIWLDESVSWDTGKRPLPELLEQVRGDIHPPGYYVLIHNWMAIAGTSPTALRMMSVLFMLVAIYAAWRLARRWLPPGPTAVALFWIAISPHLVAYAQEARMYAAVTAMVLLALLAYRQWTESAYASVLALVAFVMCMTTALYLHYFTALVMAALWLHVLIVGHRRKRLSAPVPVSAIGIVVRWAVANLVIAALYLPWAATAKAQITRGQPWRQAVTIANLPYQARVFIQETLLGPHYGVWTLITIGAVLAVAVVVIGWILFGVSLVRRRAIESDLFLFLVTLVPVAAGLALMPISGQMQLSRYLVYTSPLLILGAAYGLTQMLPRGIATAALATGAVGALTWLGAYFGDTVKDTDVRPAVAAIAASPTPPVVIVEPEYMSLPIAYYLRDRAITFPPVPSDRELHQVIDDAIAQNATAPIWVVVEGRWDRFAGFNPASDPRLVEQTLPETGLRLFAVRRPQPGQ